MCKNILLSSCFLVLLAPSLVAPLKVIAADPPTSGPVVIENPLENVDSIPDLIFTFVDVATSIGFYVAVFFILYTGFMFVTARGDTGKLKTAKEAFLWTVVGTAVLLGARVIADVIQGTLDDITIRHVDPQHEVTFS